MFKLIKTSSWSRLLRRLLIYGLLMVFVLTAGIIGCGYLYLRRSLPPVSGTLTVAGIQAPVTVYRDTSGVPHIVADNRHDLYFAQGYITATDRLFQMDLSRRAASGQLSEIFGSETIETDRFFRDLMLRRASEESLAAYPQDIVEILEAYTEGVNAWIEQAKRELRLPPEFTLLRYEPEPWSIIDSICIPKLMAYNLGTNWSDEVWRYQVTQRIGAEQASELLAEYPADAPTIMRYVSQYHPPLEELLATAPLPNLNLGSNNWVLAGEHTATGLPLLANDPHLYIQTPAIWYQSHLVLPGEELNVMGVTFAGMPGIVVGRNQEIAWGLTNLEPDVQDLYIERPNPDNPKEFLYQGSYEPAQVLVEPIYVKGRSEPILHEVLVTRHGPIITPLSTEVKEPLDVMLALKWTGHKPTTEIPAILGWNYARNWQEFRSSLRLFQAPAQNFVFASVDGTIAYRGNGEIPIRRQGNGTLPVPGWTDEYEWEGFIPFDELPEVVNPQAGFIATANNKVIDDGYPYFITSVWAPPYRQQRIVSQLETAENWRVEDMQALQNDFTDLQAANLLPILLSSLESAATPVQQQAIEILSNWDFVARADSAATAIWQTWYREFQKELLVPVIGTNLWERMFLTAEGITDRLILQASRGQVASIFPADGLTGVAERSFDTTLEHLQKRLGSAIADWKWGELHTVTFTHPLGVVKPLDLLFNTSSFAIGGGSSSINKQSSDRTKPDFPVIIAATWRFVADLSTPDRSWAILSPGQAGHPLSPYYRDRVQTWLQGNYLEQTLDLTNLSNSLRLDLLPTKPYS
ncbi:penicillin acylase family protein [Oscillatoria salina]|uniref:penicillin acylase family protein n=1 Tax=Oscillatoria salina TaxID=331517 RepID=UPI0013BCC5CB|nr:penicillin acylase family protein [Oscillatoria salina]MBZ8180965.1 penicillin acylase family protein [Oscillatoria salina IIICB1]NET89196.1 penicillin acylase family protein [Kamptonema sp. SIO1D9]